MAEMTPRSILRSGLNSMHGMLDKAVEGMTAEQLNFRPSEGGVSGFFSLWHYVRTEDNIIQFVTQRKPTVWLEGEYHEAFGLPRNAQGTGMTEDEANAVQVNDVAKWLKYQQAVWKSTDAYLAAMSPRGIRQPDGRHQARRRDVALERYLRDVPEPRLSPRGRAGVRARRPGPRRPHHLGRGGNGYLRPVR